MFTIFPRPVKKGEKIMLFTLCVSLWSMWSQPWPHILVAAAGQVAAVSVTQACPLGSHRLTMKGFLCPFSSGDCTFDLGLSHLDLRCMRLRDSHQVLSILPAVHPNAIIPAILFHGPSPQALAAGALFPLPSLCTHFIFSAPP